MTLEWVYNHLVLPPKVPGGQCPHLDEEAQDFVGRLFSAVDTLDKSHFPLCANPFASAII